MPNISNLAVSDVRLLGVGKVTISTATTSNFTPDINLAANANYKHGDKLLVVFTSTSASSSSTVSFVVQDAPDNAGSIGTPAAATTDGVLTGGTGDQRAHTFVRVKSDRPWLRCRVTNSGTDAHVATVAVYAVGPAV